MSISQFGLAFISGAISGAATYGRSVILWANGTKPTKIDGILSARRIKALSFISEVVPSKIGDDRFSKLAPGYRRVKEGDTIVSYANSTKLPKGFTGCGYLPCYVGRRLGDPRGITQCGLEGARKNAKEQNAWIDAGDDRRPKPGDILLYVNNSNVPLHIGFFIGINEDGTWKTADGGQANASEVEEAKYLTRVYDPVKVTLGGRKLAGWVDLDKVKIQNIDSVSGQVVDVRTASEFEKNHIEGAINIHVDDIVCPESKLPIESNRPVYVYCKTGGRSRRAAHHLKSMGYNVTDLGAWSP